MARLPLGGDSTVSHFSADVKYLLPGESSKEQRERRRAQWDKMKELGFRMRYFNFKNKDSAAKAKAKADCEVFAAEWESKLGFKLDVSEGCFL